MYEHILIFHLNHEEPLFPELPDRAEHRELWVNLPPSFSLCGNIHDDVSECDGCAGATDARTAVHQCLLVGL